MHIKTVVQTLSLEVARFVFASSEYGWELTPPHKYMPDNFQNSMGIVWETGSNEGK